MRSVLVFNPHSFVDVITNSSSELFVGQANNKEYIIELIESIYPNYLSEYHPVKSTEELDRWELEAYLNYRYEYWSNSQQRFVHEKIPGLTKQEMAELQKKDYYHDIVTEDEDRTNRIKKGIDPEGKMFFLFSIDDNPDWDEQEKLMEVFQRFHLG